MRCSALREAIAFCQFGAWKSQGDFGSGQTWQDVLAFRSTGVTYANATSKMITVVVNSGSSSGGYCLGFLNGKLLVANGSNTGSWSYSGYNGDTGCGAAWPKVYSQLYGPEN